MTNKVVGQRLIIHNDIPQIWGCQNGKLFFTDIIMLSWAGYSRFGDHGWQQMVLTNRKCVVKIWFRRGEGGNYLTCLLSYWATHCSLVWTYFFLFYILNMEGQYLYTTPYIILCSSLLHSLHRMIGTWGLKSDLFSIWKISRAKRVSK